MEKYSKILIYIFLLSMLNFCISGYLIFKLNYKTEVKPNNFVVTTTPKQSPTPSPKVTGSQEDIKSDLIQIKAEIRSLRDSIEDSGILIETPKP